MMNPIWPNAQPWDNVLFVITAVITVWLNRRTMFQRGSGVTSILMPEQAIWSNIITGNIQQEGMGSAKGKKV
jgi:hypothetical protein